MWFARVDQLTVWARSGTCHFLHGRIQRHQAQGDRQGLLCTGTAIFAIVDSTQQDKANRPGSCPQLFPKATKTPLVCSHRLSSPAALKHRRIALRKQKETSGEVGRRSKSEVSLVSQSALYTDGLGR